MKAGLFGRPLSKSLSQAVFGAFSRILGSPISYELRECGADELADALSAARAEGWAGFNATLPHKRAVYRMLDSAQRAAKDTGAANAARFSVRGLEGTNTDAYALCRALAARGISVKGLSAAVFGAGGAAAAAAWALADSGARRVDLCARNGAAAKSLADALAKAFSSTSFGARPFAPPPAGHAVWVNATPIGMYAAGTLPCAPRRGDVCVDWAYAAGGTEFLRAATAAGALEVDGLDLLVWQAALALEFWGGFSGGDIVEFKNEASALLERRIGEGR